MYYRYEFSKGTEYPHTGIFHGLDDAFSDRKGVTAKMKETIMILWNIFEEYLPNPSSGPDAVGLEDWITSRFACAFTEHGNAMFRNEISAIINMVDEIPWAQLVCITLPDNDTFEKYGGVYRDAFQVVFPYAVFEGPDAHTVKVRRDPYYIHDIDSPLGYFPESGHKLVEIRLKLAKARIAHFNPPKGSPRVAMT